MKTIRLLFLLIFLSFPLLSYSQSSSDPSLRFQYHGQDLKISRLRANNMYLGSLAISLFEYDPYYSDYYVPLLFTISGEYGRRLLYPNDNASFSVNLTPHIAVSHLFAGKFSTTINLNLFNSSTYENKSDMGLVAGCGGEILFSSFGNSGIYPIVRIGFLIDNFRFIYQQALSNSSNSKYTLIFSSKIDL